MLLYLEDTSIQGFHSSLDCGMGLELLVGWGGEAALAFTFSAAEVLHHAAKQAAVKVYCSQNSLAQGKYNCKLWHYFTSLKFYVCHHLLSTRDQVPFPNECREPWPSGITTCFVLATIRIFFFYFIRDRAPAAQGCILSKYTVCVLIKYTSQITVLFWKVLSESRQGVYGRRWFSIMKSYHCRRTQKWHSRRLSYQKLTHERKSQGTSSILFSTIGSAAFEPLSAVVL